MILRLKVQKLNDSWYAFVGYPNGTTVTWACRSTWAEALVWGLDYMRVRKPS